MPTRFDLPLRQAICSATILSSVSSKLEINRDDEWSYLVSVRSPCRI